MRQRNKARSTHDRVSSPVAISLGLAMLIPLAGGCGAMQRSERGYYFNHTLLNESWSAPYFQRTQEESRRAKASGRGASRDSKSASLPLEASPQQWLRGSDEQVVRAEMVASAQRLVGLKNSFEADEFLRHLLVVNNLVPAGTEAEGLVQRLYKPGTASLAPAAGDILFLGEGTPDLAVVVEKVDSDGTVTFIGVIGEEVGRGLLNTRLPDARRDEASGRTLNTYLKGNRLAGQSLLAVFSLGSGSQPAR